MKMGRPTIYTEELAELVCLRMAIHSEGIKKICEMYDDMPDNTTIYAWMYHNEDFSRRFLKAREKRAHTLHEFIRELSEKIHEFEGVDKDGFVHVDSGLVACYKMRVAVLQKHIEQINPYYAAQKDKAEDKAVDNAAHVLSESLKALVKSKEKEFQF